jgi:hypothetical protein
MVLAERAREIFDGPLIPPPDRVIGVLMQCGR